MTDTERLLSALAAAHPEQSEAILGIADRIKELEALLGDPTPEMIKAGATCKPWMAGWPKGEEAAADVWRAMVAKALEQGENGKGQENE